jgi:hypothetical protein
MFSVAFVLRVLAQILAGKPHPQLGVMFSALCHFESAPCKYGLFELELATSGGTVFVAIKASWDEHRLLPGPFWKSFLMACLSAFRGQSAQSEPSFLLVVDNRRSVAGKLDVLLDKLRPQFLELAKQSKSTPVKFADVSPVQTVLALVSGAVDAALVRDLVYSVNIAAERIEPRTLTWHEMFSVLATVRLVVTTAKSEFEMSNAFLEPLVADVAAASGKLFGCLSMAMAKPWDAQVLREVVKVHDS